MIRNNTANILLCYYKQLYHATNQVFFYRPVGKLSS